MNRTGEIYTHLLRDVWNLASPVCSAIYADWSEYEYPESEALSHCRKTNYTGAESVLVDALVGNRVAVVLPSSQASLLNKDLTEMNRLKATCVYVMDAACKSHISSIADTNTVILEGRRNLRLDKHLQLAFEIAELELRPVVLFIQSDQSNQSSEQAQGSLLLPNPAHIIPSPNPLQELQFGKMRRRIPIWLSTDQALSIGSARPEEDRILEIASRYEYIDQDFSQRLDALRISNPDLRDIPPYSTHWKARERKIILSDFSDARLESMYSEYKEFRNSGWTWIGLSQLFPIPSGLLAQLRNAKRICVVESVQTGRQGWLMRELRTELASISFQNCLYANRPDAVQLKALVKKLNSDTSTLLFWLDVPMYLSGTNYPKHEVLLQHSIRISPEINKKGVATNNKSSRTPVVPPIPKHIRSFQDKGAPYTRIGRFYDDVAALKSSPGNEIFADPFQNLAVIPPASAGFIGPADTNKYLPEFRANDCVACGDCLIQCPQNALLASMQTVSSLIDNAIRTCNESGKPIRKLMPHKKTLGNLFTDAIRLSASGIPMKDLCGSVRQDFLNDLFRDDLDTQSAEITIEFDALAAQLMNLSLTKAEFCFDEYEKRERGSGLLFSLGVNADSCTACGMCEESCDSSAILMKEKTQNSELRLREQFDANYNLPDTKGEHIRNLSADPAFNPLAAAMLSRHFTRSYSGAAVNNEHIPERTIIKSFLTVAEQFLQAKQIPLRKRIKDCIPALSENIRTSLSNAVPKGDLEELLNAVDHSAGKISLEQILSDWKAASKVNKVDAKILHRRLVLLEDLKKLLHLLESGIHGSGRSLYTLVVDQSLNWLTMYPWNSFSVPVFTPQSESALQAAGHLSEVQRNKMLDNIRILKRAELEVSGTYDPITHDSELNSLTLEKLTTEEQFFIPPVCLVTTKQSLLSEGADTLSRILNDHRTLRCLVLEEMPETSGMNAFPGILPALTHVMLNRSTFISRTSLYNYNKAYQSMLSGVSASGSAVVVFPVPQFKRIDGHIGKWMQFTHFAEDCRAYFPFEFRPVRAINSISQGLEFPEGFAEGRLWREITLRFISGGADMEMSYTLSWADFAFSLKKYRNSFKHIKHTEHCIPVTDYLRLEMDKRTDRIPVIVRQEEDGHLIWYAIGPEIVRRTEFYRNELQFAFEIAGVGLQVPDKLKRQIERTLKREFEEEKTDLEKQWADERRNLENEILARVRLDLKKRLMQLSSTKQ